MAIRSFGPFSVVGRGWGNRTYELEICQHLVLVYGFDPVFCCRTLYLLAYYQKDKDRLGYGIWKYQPSLLWGTDQHRQDQLSQRELWNMLWERMKWW